MTPDQLYQKYAGGYQGCPFNSYETEQFLSTMSEPMFGDAGRSLYGSGKGKLSILYKAVITNDPNAYEERQTTGDCTSHGSRNAADITRANNPSGTNWTARGATEPIYGARGHRGEGMSVARAMQYLSSIGGVIERKKYSSIDLSVYNSRIGSNWNPTPAAVNALGKDFQITAALITEVEQVRDALANGYGVVFGANYGFSRTRDSGGIAKRAENWNHCMSITAGDDTGSDFLSLVQNSWGPWNSGGHPSWGPIPPGSFLIRSDDLRNILRQRQTYVISDVKGFEPRKLKDYGTSTFL